MDELTRSQFEQLLMPLDISQLDHAILMAHDAALRQEIELLKGENETLSELAGERRQEVARLTAERDAWTNTAAEFHRGLEFYHGLVVTIGDTCGEDAYIADDGSRSQDVLCIKVPELVVRLKATLARVEGERDSAVSMLETHQSESQNRLRRLVKCEQERDQFNATLQRIAQNDHLTYGPNPSQYDIGVADGHRCAAGWAQQALTPKA